MQDFGLNTFVDIIPVLLHTSLFLFFGGLVAFLLPVNRSLTYVMAGVLVVFLAVYVGLTFLPLIFLNSPYRTPLSGVLWRLGNSFGDFLARAHELPVQERITLTQAILEKSVQITAERAERDAKLVDHTMKSSVDDGELLPFIEAIPDAIYDPSSPNRLRKDNIGLVIRLLTSVDPEANVLSRILEFLSRSRSWTDEFRTRCSLTCPRAIWSLALASIDVKSQRPRLSPSHTSEHCRLAHDLMSKYVTVFPFSTLRTLDTSTPTLGKDMWSASLAMVRLNWLHSVCSTIDMLEDFFNAVASPWSLFEAIQLCHSVLSVTSIEIYISPGSSLVISCIPSDLKRKLDETLLSYLNLGDYVIERIQPLVYRLKDKDIWRPVRLCILQEYLLFSQHSVNLSGQLPLEFEFMCRTIYRSSEVPIGPINIDSYLPLDPSRPLLALKRHVEGKELNDTTDMLLRQHLKLLFSTVIPLCSRQQLLECKRFVRWYIVRRDDNFSDSARQARWTDFDAGDIRCIGECIQVEDVQSPEENMTEEPDSSLRTAFILLTVGPWWRKSMFLEVLVFLPEVFVTLANTPPQTMFKQGEGYAFFKTLLDLVLSFVLRAPDDAESHSLPQHLVHQIKVSLCQTYLLPHFLPIDSIGSKSCKDTLLIAIVSRYVDLSCDAEIPRYCGVLQSTYFRNYTSISTVVHETSQLLFANSIARLVKTIEGERSEKTQSLVFTLHEVISIFCDQIHLGDATKRWRWVTSRESAQIISDAISQFREPENIPGLSPEQFVGVDPRNRKDRAETRDALLRRCRVLLTTPEPNLERRV
ncbi:hypothetical protein K435DRAFT_846604 [Dendrothele bispora CBS 962.96]|uniref:Uncharacterized protein n=1 Tax=Dendrothele bispora (strain CBS 962.96) TaxID=1314807 RepID=A0A4S8KLK9_DENBC|nr:hypothetical protein K435DRAFT_846604 [Dendrothele bispora CBS 962.96]